MPIHLPPPPPAEVCVAQAVYHEARGATHMDMAHTAELVWNRSRDLHRSPCHIVAMRGQFPWYRPYGRKIRYSRQEWDMWSKSLSLAHLKRQSTSPIRYMVSAPLFHRIQLRERRMGIHSTIHVLSQDRYLVFYNRYNDRLWKSAR